MPQKIPSVRSYSETHDEHALMSLHGNSYRYKNSKAYTFVPAEPSGEQALSIRRATGEIRLNCESITSALWCCSNTLPPAIHNSAPEGHDLLMQNVFGIMGIISLAYGALCIESVLICCLTSLRRRLHYCDMCKGAARQLHGARHL